MSLVTLTNTRRESFAFTLYHSVMCSEGDCECKKDDMLRSVEGGLKYHTIVTPKGVHLEPGMAVTLDSKVLNIPQVQEALKRGILQQVKKQNTKNNDSVGRTT